MVMVLIALILALLGLVLGSFVNALVWRLHQQELAIENSQLPHQADLSILHGRSMCPGCGHRLSARDLVPVFSWLALRGHCRYCSMRISLQYPLVELLTAIIFGVSYYFWPGGLDSGGLILLAAWLAASVGLLALLIYDARWMLLPSKIIYPTLAVATAGRLTYLIAYEPDKTQAVFRWLAALVLCSGMFWLLFMISRGRLIGYGDVRLGLVTGTLLASPSRSFLMLFLASTLGLVFALPGVFKGRKNLSSQLPFGPFLIVATGLVVFVGDRVINWYTNLFSG